MIGFVDAKINFILGKKAIMESDLKIRIFRRKKEIISSLSGIFPTDIWKMLLDLIAKNDLSIQTLGQLAQTNSRMKELTLQVYELVFLMQYPEEYLAWTTQDGLLPEKIAFLNELTPAQRQRPDTLWKRAVEYVTKQLPIAPTTTYRLDWFLEPITFFYFKKNSIQITGATGSMAYGRKSFFDSSKEVNQNETSYSVRRANPQTPIVYVSPNSYIKVYSGWASLQSQYFNTLYVGPDGKPVTKVFAHGGIVHFSPDSSMFAMISNTFTNNNPNDGLENQIIYVYDSDNGDVLQQITSTETFLDVTVAFSPDNKYLTVGERTNFSQLIVMYSVKTGQKTNRMAMDDFFAVNTRLAYSPDGTTIVVSTTYGPTIITLNYKQRRDLRTPWNTSIKDRRDPPATQIPYQSNANIAFTKDSQKFAIGYMDSIIVIYSTRSGDILHVLQQHDGGARRLQDYSRYLEFYDNGTKLVSGTQQHNIQVWENLEDRTQPFLVSKKVTCNNVGCEKDPVAQCANCQTSYCSKDCQENDWNQHRIKCRY